MLDAYKRTLPLGDVYRFARMGIEARKRGALRDSCPALRLAEERLAWFDGYDAAKRCEELPVVLRFPGHGFCFFNIVSEHEQPKKGQYFLIPPSHGLPLVMLAKTNRTGFFTTIWPTHKATPRISYDRGEPIT